jgi:hypothetical protein
MGCKQHIILRGCVTCRLTYLSCSRWLRLLFTREFSMPDALKLWDGLFACDSTLHLAQWVCVAMLIRIRNERASSYHRLMYPFPHISLSDFL